MIEHHSLQGLLHARLLDGNGGSRDFEWSSVSSWTAEQGGLWLHFNFEETEVSEWLHGQSNLNSAFSPVLWA
jgi:zinc transporter